MGVSEPTPDVLGGVLRRITEVIGPGAAYSMFHYAAVLEGQRLASGATNLQAALGHIEALLGLQVRVVEDGAARVVVQLDAIAPGALDDRGLQGLLLGLLEGALTAGRHRPFKPLGTGNLRPNGGPLRVEFGSGNA